MDSVYRWTLIYWRIFHLIDIIPILSFEIARKFDMMRRFDWEQMNAREVGFKNYFEKRSRPIEIFEILGSKCSTSFITFLIKNDEKYEKYLGNCWMWQVSRMAVSVFAGGLSMTLCLLESGSSNLSLSSVFDLRKISRSPSVISSREILRSGRLFVSRGKLSALRTLRQSRDVDPCLRRNSLKGILVLISHTIFIHIQHLMF